MKNVGYILCHKNFTNNYNEVFLLVKFFTFPSLLYVYNNTGMYIINFIIIKYMYMYNI